MRSDLSVLDPESGSVLHVRAYTSRGHPPKDKFLFVIGRETPAVLLAFLISSQMRWMRSETHRRETVVIPVGTTPFLRRESFIQCWELERLDVDAVRAGIERKTIECCGSLPKRFLQRVREAIDDPYLLESGDAFAARWVIDRALA